MKMGKIARQKTGKSAECDADSGSIRGGDPAFEPGRRGDVGGDWTGRHGTLRNDGVSRSKAAD